MFRIWSNHTKRYIFPNLKGNTYEELKEMFSGRLYTITLASVIDDHVFRDGVANHKEIKETVDATSFEEKMKYCNFEIRKEENV